MQNESPRWSGSAGCNNVAFLSDSPYNEHDSINDGSRLTLHMDRLLTQRVIGAVVPDMTV